MAQLRAQHTKPLICCARTCAKRAINQHHERHRAQTIMELRNQIRAHEPGWDVLRTYNRAAVVSSDARGCQSRRLGAVLGPDQQSHALSAWIAEVPVLQWFHRLVGSIARGWECHGKMAPARPAARHARSTPPDPPFPARSHKRGRRGKLAPRCSAGGTCLRVWRKVSRSGNFGSLSSSRRSAYATGKDIRPAMTRSARSRAWCTTTRASENRCASTKGKAFR